MVMVPVKELQVMGASLTLFRTVAMPRELVNWQLVIMELSPQSHHPHVITSVHVLVLLKMMASLMSLRTVVMQRRLAWILGVTHYTHHDCYL